MVNAAGNIGRAIFLALTTVVQNSVVAEASDTSIKDVVSIRKGNPASLKGLRMADLFNCVLVLPCMVICFFFFRGTGIVGEIPGRPGHDKTSGESEAGMKNDPRGDKADEKTLAKTEDVFADKT